MGSYEMFYVILVVACVTAMACVEIKSFVNNTYDLIEYRIYAILSGLTILYIIEYIVGLYR